MASNKTILFLAEQATFNILQDYCSVDRPIECLLYRVVRLCIIEVFTPQAFLQLLSEATEKELDMLLSLPMDFVVPPHLAYEVSTCVNIVSQRSERPTKERVYLLLLSIWVRKCTYKKSLEAINLRVQAYVNDTKNTEGFLIRKYVYSMPSEQGCIEALWDLFVIHNADSKGDVDNPEIVNITSMISLVRGRTEEWVDTMEMCVDRGSSSAASNLALYYFEVVDYPIEALVYCLLGAVEVRKDNTEHVLPHLKIAVEQGNMRMVDMLRTHYPSAWPAGVLSVHGDRGTAKAMKYVNNLVLMSAQAGVGIFADGTLYNLVENILRIPLPPIVASGRVTTCTPTKMNRTKLGAFELGVRLSVIPWKQKAGAILNYIKLCKRDGVYKYLAFVATCMELRGPMLIKDLLMGVSILNTYLDGCKRDSMEPSEGVVELIGILQSKITK